MQRTYSELHAYLINVSNNVMHYNILICGTPIIIIFLFQTDVWTAHVAGDDGRYKNTIPSHKTMRFGVLHTFYGWVRVYLWKKKMKKMYDLKAPFNRSG